MYKLTTCLWFEKGAEEAAAFYVDLFKGIGHSASIGKTTRYDKSSAEVSGQPEGSVLTVEFELDGMGFLGLNGGPMLKFSGATSFVIDCQTQKEIDYFWGKLSEGGEPGQCGWINRDKYGLTWQVVPRILTELISNPDPKISEPAMKAMLKMTKIDISVLSSQKH